jgi:hypothetical protein
MKFITHSCTVETLQGFEVYHLANEVVSLKVVPGLGAKIISLKNLCSGREWLWHPSGGLKLFTNHAGDDFSKSPLIGVDECVPTIAPCLWRGRNLPDHGEAWTAKWSVDREAWQNGILKTSLQFGISPLRFERTIELDGNEICLNYQLHNLSTQTESYLWAIHPLLKLEPDDRLELPASTRSLLKGATWVDAISSAIPANRCAKVFARPITEGLAGLHNRATGDRLDFIWDVAENDTLGLWLTRGGWHEHHHFAIEPTNGNDDALTVAAEQKRGRQVAASNSIDWQLRLRISS